MGVKDLLQDLSGGGDVKVCTRVGFSTLEILRIRPDDIDTDVLIFICALRRDEAYTKGTTL